MRSLGLRARMLLFFAALGLGLWLLDEGLDRQSRAGQVFGYTDRSYFPVDRLARIIPLSRERIALLEGRLPTP